MISDPNFPRLTSRNHRITSPPTSQYNCIAWSAGDPSRWWQPGVYWPIEAGTDDFGIDTLEIAFASLGYEKADLTDFEPGFEKVAFFASNPFYTHACRQLPDGKWTSKLGRSEDIEHDTPDDVAGGVYGEVVAIMKRPTLPV